MKNFIPYNEYDSFTKVKGRLELVILIWLCNLNTVGKCKCLQNKFLYIEFEKHITLLRAKLLAKIIERSIGNKKNCCKEKSCAFSKWLSYLTSTSSLVMYQENLKFPWMYVDTVFCAFVRSCWMAYIASYWRSIKFNEFIARVQNKYYYKKCYVLW